MLERINVELLLIIMLAVCRVSWLILTYSLFFANENKRFRIAAKL